MEKTLMFSEIVKGNARTYFFDIKKASNDTPYLLLTESKKSKEGGYEKIRIIVFQDDMPAFAEMVGKSKEVMEPAPSVTADEQ
jgi:hypothetical protein